MSLGDVDGTGRLALFLLVRVATTDRLHTHRPDKHGVVEHCRLRHWRLSTSVSDRRCSFALAPPPV